MCKRRNYKKGKIPFFVHLCSGLRVYVYFFCIRPICGFLSFAKLGKNQKTEIYGSKAAVLGSFWDNFGVNAGKFGIRKNSYKTAFLVQKREKTTHFQNSASDELKKNQTNLLFFAMVMLHSGSPSDMEQYPVYQDFSNSQSL